jgi:hypothetical protein
MMHRCNLRRSILAKAIRAGWIALALPGTAVLAHHSYAMFDMSTTNYVQGSVAKVEWINPHVIVWLYVRSPDKPGEFELYAFENGPINILTHLGWKKDSLKAGDKVSVQYFPLRDGRKGGHYVKAVRADGSELPGDLQMPAVARELARKSPAEVPKP